MSTCSNVVFRLPPETAPEALDRAIHLVNRTPGAAGALHRGRGESVLFVYYDPRQLTPDALLAAVRTQGIDAHFIGTPGP